MKDFKVSRCLSNILFLLALACMGLLSGHALAKGLSGIRSEPTDSLSNNALLQYSAHGHVLGFQHDRVYFASLDHTIVEEFVGAKSVAPMGTSPEGTNGVSGAPSLGSVTYTNLWQGITLKYEAKRGDIAESTFLVDSAADVADIRLKYNVAAAIQKDGSLRFKLPSQNGYFSQSAPNAWQDIAGKRIPVAVAFTDYGGNIFGFSLGEYRRDYPVIIDPTYQWHTFFGSVAGADLSNAIAVDPTGNVYVTGYSTATWNGPGAAAPLNAHSGGADIVVLKLNSSGAYQWHTFYGSASSDTGNGIAVNGAGDVYVTGYSVATWSGPGATAPLNAGGGAGDIVVLKLNTNGAYQWHTFYGSGTQPDRGQGVAVDIGGNVYVTGFSYATWNGPGQPDAFEFVQRNLRFF